MTFDPKTKDPRAKQAPLNKVSGRKSIIRAYKNLAIVSNCDFANRHSSKTGRRGSGTNLVTKACSCRLKSQAFSQIVDGDFVMKRPRRCGKKVRNWSS
jgi:hypothetical protein